MLKNLIGVIEDTTKIATAPAEVALSLTRSITKPLADAAEDISNEINESLEDFRNE